MTKKTKVKEKQSDPGVGHNSDWSEDQFRKILIQGVVEIEGLLETIDALKTEVKSTVKQLKADGFEKYEIDFALKLRKSEDETADLQKWGRMKRTALFVNHPIGTQPDLPFGEFADRTPLVDHAFEEGKVAGIEGKPRKPPHSENTDAGRKWIEGWNAGQGILVERGITAPVHELQSEAA